MQEKPLKPYKIRKFPNIDWETIFYSQPDLRFHDFQNRMKKEIDWSNYKPKNKKDDKGTSKTTE